jgi:hypothetical protein
MSMPPESSGVSARMAFGMAPVRLLWDKPKPLQSRLDTHCVGQQHQCPQPLHDRHSPQASQRAEPLWDRASQLVVAQDQVPAVTIAVSQTSDNSVRHCQ